MNVPRATDPLAYTKWKEERINNILKRKDLKLGTETSYILKSVY